MRQVAVLSGKGGTGKTSIVASLAHLMAPVVAVDCDVDAANLALLMAGEEKPAFTVHSGFQVQVKTELCSGCGACLEACRFGAVSMVEDVAHVDRLRCEGCRACSLVCPESAIDARPRLAGMAWVRATPSGPLVHAELAIAQDNSGHLVSYVRELANRIAEERHAELLLLDGPPGLGCPVHATLAGVSLVLIVVEPTPSAAQDLGRLLELLASWKIPAGVLLNKATLSKEGADNIRALCNQRGVELVGSLPFDERIPRLLSHGKLPLEAGSSVSKPLRQVATWIEHAAAAHRQ